MCVFVQAPRRISMFEGLKLIIWGTQIFLGPLTETYASEVP